MSEAAPTRDGRDETDPEQQLETFEVGDRFGVDPTRQWEVVGTRSDGLIIESPGGCTFAARVHEDGVWLHSGPNSSNRVIQIRKFASPMDAQITVTERLDEGDVFEVEGQTGTFKITSILSNGSAAEVAKGGRNGWMGPNYHLQEGWKTFGVPARLKYLPPNNEQYDFEISVRDLMIL